MDEFCQILRFYSESPISILDVTIPIQAYTPIDLSLSNELLEKLDLSDPTVCQHYIDEILGTKDALVAYGGYLEKRRLYADKPEFNNEGVLRNIHLGMDFWTRAGTIVRSPIDGEVHGYKNNHAFGDYGPTIILKHELKKATFFTLYGHLSVESLEGLYIGKRYNKGDALATLGTPDINVGYAPHLHFQIIGNMKAYDGTYPGVCSAPDQEFYSKNCPDPNLLLKIP